MYILADGRDLRMIQTTFSLFGRSASVGLFNVIMVHGSELFPTVIRLVDYLYNALLHVSIHLS